jgi:hypothetical protein
MKRSISKFLLIIGVLLLASFTYACDEKESNDSSAKPTKDASSAISTKTVADASSSSGKQSYLVDSNAINLGLAATFAVFGGGAGMTNQGTGTVIVGDMGTTGSSTMITGFHNSAFSYTETPLNVGAVTGTIYTAPPQGTAASFAIATATAADALAAFNFLAGLPDGIDPGAGQLGGLSLRPGVYKSASGAFLITGSDLTLDANGDANAVWVFQMASSLTVGTPTAPRSIVLANGALAKNVYWQVGSAATINGAGGGLMVGTIISSAAITFSTAGNATVTTLNGRALALNASVTMVNTVINAYGVNMALPVAADPALSHLTVDGINATDVATTITLGGFVTVHNAGGHVAATVTGSGAINATNNGGALTVTETGSGTVNITNNLGVLTATNTGNGVMTINSTCTAAVTVTNTGNGNVTVNASGAGAVTYTHTGNEDVTVTLP